MDILKLREQIDVIDDNITKLYAERMSVVKMIGEEKAKGSKMVLDANREKNIINRVTKTVDDDIKVYTKQVFNTIFDTSRALQMKSTSAYSKSVEKIEYALKNREAKFPFSGFVACQGVEGAYSNLAAEKLFELCDISYFKTFDSVFQAVESGFCQYGLLPIENSSVGSVNAVYDLMKQHKFYIVKAIKLRVSHNLLVNKGVKKQQIKEIFSHEQAINQSMKYLRDFKDAKITVCDNTAVAAKMVAESGRDDIAAISSISCAGTYGLDIIDKNIQDQDDNYTRFILISKTLKLYPHANKISIMTPLAHEPGSLNKMLGKFATMGLSLTKIESRPMPGTSFEFMFYFDFLGDIEDKSIQNLLAELENSDQNFSFLGAFQEQFSTDL